MGARAAKIDFHEAGRPFEEKGKRRLAQALRRTMLRAVRERAQTRFPLRNTSKYLQSSGIRGILWETMKYLTAAAQEET